MNNLSFSHTCMRRMQGMDDDRSHPTLQRTIQPRLLHERLSDVLTVNSKKVTFYRYSLRSYPCHYGM